MHPVTSQANKSQGAGEALRGAFNSELDKRTGAPPEALAAHNAVIDRGRAEIETGKYQHQQRPVRPQADVQQDHLTLPQEKDKKSRIRNMLRKSKDGLGPVSEERV
jgi:hypothetical protein